MIDLNKVKRGLDCCDGDGSCLTCPYESTCLWHEISRELIHDALKAIEMLEGVIKADPQYFTYEILTVVRDVCEGYLHCSECPLSDADGDCPFIGKDGRRLKPSEWELWRVGGQNEEL